MVDEVGQDEAPVETPAVEAPEIGAENSQTAETQSDGHPAWAPIRDALGEALFHKIKPNLAEFDAAANKRITETNSKYEPWKSFETEGHTPDVVRRALGIVRGIDSNPLQMYEVLGNHLREQGLLQEIAQQVQSEQPNEGEEMDPRDKALADLQAQNEQILAMFQSQQAEAQRAEYDRQADSALEAEINALRQARPDTTREEEGRFLNQLALYMRAGQHDMTLERIAQEYDADRNRILSQPRPNDFAPRIPGSGGTAPTGNPQQKAPAEYSRQESQDLLADLVSKAVSGGR